MPGKPTAVVDSDDKESNSSEDSLEHSDDEESKSSEDSLDHSDDEESNSSEDSLEHSDDEESNSSEDSLEHDNPDLAETSIEPTVAASRNDQYTAFKVGSFLMEVMCLRAQYLRSPYLETTVPTPDQRPNG